ncbi:serine hydrolase [Puniceicoccus vermicola]|uniref:Serine hydrolase n=1 Tax=Puniceicoccus vermicola TaxID=388746 RepID=A0A7X1AWE2_9BACT|nr:serine hydrolase [Puniceicoccus vermicola]MBC2601029.1 serine hydrolase [Puniceicoccus vermicola]
MNYSLARLSFSIALPFIGLFSASLPCSAAESTLPPDLDSYIESGMSEWQLPGLSIAVVKDGESILVKGYGVREAGGSEPVDENTVFAIGSASKAFTATALGMLVDQDEVQWNTKIHEIDPDFKLSDPWVTQEIRLSDLPSNHSGLSAVSEALWYGSGLTKEEIIDRLQYVPISEGFRYQFQYRNTMFLLAGEMIPHLVDQTWAEFLEAEIFAPLGMDRSLPTNVGVEDMDNVASPHLLGYDNQLIPVPYRDMTNIGPAGSIMSTASNLVPWLKLHLGQSEVPLLTEGTLRYLHTSQTPMWSISPDGAVRNSPFQLHSYCLGWTTESYKGLRLVWHNGNIDGMSAWVGLVPELGLGVAMLTNLDDCEFRTAVFYQIVDHVAGIDGDDQESQPLTRYENKITQRDEAEEEWQQLAASDIQPALDLANYAGQYHSDLLGTATIEVTGNRLTFVRTPEQTLELVPTAAGSNDFIGRHTNPNEDLRTGKVDVTFAVEDGKVLTLVDHSEGAPIPFTKVEK